MESAKVIIQVTAGMILGVPMSEYDKSWRVSSKEWEEKTLPYLLEVIGKANSYALYLQLLSANGFSPNWVHVEYTWL